MSKELAIAFQDLNDNEVKLSPGIVKKYLLPEDTKVSDAEMVMFLKLCEFQQLNPFLREVYLVKYGNQKAQMVTGKETFLKRAKRDPAYQGHKTWIEGTIPNMTATAEVYVKGYQVPITCTVDYEEYVGRNAQGVPNKMWNSKPKTMLKKVSLVQAMREAFPDTFGGLYSQEEISDVDPDSLPVADVSVTANAPASSKPASTVTPKTEEIPVVEGIMEGKPEVLPKPAAKPEEEPVVKDEADEAHGNMSDEELMPDDPLLPEGAVDKILITFKKEGRYDLEALERAVNKPSTEWCRSDSEKLIALYQRIKARQN